MTTYNTGNPLGSAAAKDLFDNAQNLDFAINDITKLLWSDRFGRERKTWYGIQKQAEQAMLAFGYVTMDSFEDGATLTLPNQVLRWESNGEYYRWDGGFPKTVPASSTPQSAGGIGSGAWLSVGDATLRSNLASTLQGLGASLIGTESGSNVQSILSSIKRSDGFYKATFEDAVTFNIPGDYESLQAAVDDLHVQTIAQGKKIILNIQSGYQEKYGLKCQFGDFSHFYIKSEDAQVQVSDDFIGVGGPDTDDYPSSITSGSLIMAYHARGPILGCIFNGRQIARTLYFALGGSHGWSDRLSSSTEEEPNAKKIAGGVNFRHATFQAQEASIIVCENAIGTGCLLYSIYCERNSVIHAEFCDVSGSKGGVVATRAGMVNADTVNANNCELGFWAHRQATISASDSTADNCSGNGYRTDTGGKINAHNTSAQNCTATSTQAGIYPGVAYLAYRGGQIICTGGSNASGATNQGLLAIFGGHIVAYQVVASNCGVANIMAQAGSHIEADNATCVGGAGRSVYAYDGSVISLSNSTITNATGNAVTADYGSRISARGCNISGSAARAVYCLNGSNIDVTSATISSTGTNALYTEGGNINAKQVTINTTGQSSVYANMGGEINLYSGVISGTGSGTNVYSLRVQNGGRIIASAATYSTMNIGTINQLSTNGYIIG